MKLHELTIKEAGEKLKSGEITSVGLTKAVFERIAEVESKVAAYVTLCEQMAMEMARESDKRRKAGKILSEIDGIPIAVKDLFLTKGVKTTAGSKMLEDFIPINESTVTERLWSAGAVLVGKTNLDEFAMGSSTENSAYGITHNPWDLSRVPGGSSGGSAAAVAADECVAAIGTDTGGSIRQPASFCGIVGLKVTYGLVPRLGVVSYASSFDTMGPLTKSVEDAAIVLRQIAGTDVHDSTSTKDKLPDYAKCLSGDIKGVKIGVPKEFFGEGLDPRVKKAIEAARDQLVELGAEVSEVSLPLTEYAIPAYYILVKSEASSNLSRYDGIRYGHSILKDKKEKNITLEQAYSLSRTEGFGDEAKRSIMMGTHTLSSGYFDAYYKKAARVRTKIKQEYEKIFQEYDCLIAPVSPFPAFKIGEKVSDPLAMYMSDIDTAPINIAGVPALSVPAGFVDEKGVSLPVGLQIIGPMFGETKILNVGYAFEQATEWHKRKPEIK